MDHQIVTVPATSLVSLTHKGPYRNLKQSWGTLVDWAVKQEGLVTFDPCLTLCLNSPAETAEEDLLSACCIALAPGQEGWSGDEAAGLTRLDMEEQKCAVFRYVGPYEGLADAWGKVVSEAMPAAGLEFSGLPPFEVYRNNPREVAPEELITDIHIPVK